MVFHPNDVFFNDGSVMNPGDESQQPAFTVGDRVIELDRGRVGSVVKAYILAGAYRYLVQFDADGSEQAFYGFELDLEHDKPLP